jgi:leader peptidase (prepilin peptidase)/N-methyltransferase
MPGDATPALHVIALVFTGVLGACCGSFLNVVVYRLPNAELPDDAGFLRGTWLSIKALSHPPSHCPKCDYKLAWFDNVPVLGWLWLRGRCRKCKVRISPQYPLVELFTGVLFAGLYAAFFLAGPGWGPPTPAMAWPEPVAVPPSAMVGDGLLDAARDALPAEARVVAVEATPAGRSSLGGVPTMTLLVRAEALLAEHWPMLGIVLLLVFCLLAASLIDARYYLIPRELSYLPALVAIPVHAIFDEPDAPLSVMVGPVGCAWAIGGGVGLIGSLLLLRSGRLARSYATDVPMMGVEREAADLPELTAQELTAERVRTRREMLRELAFLALPIGLGLLAAVLAIGPMAGMFEAIASNRAASAGLGSLLGGLVGGGVIWAVRLLGSVGFGKEAMGLGDVDLMFGVGCVIGAGPAGIAVFPAALVGLLFTVGRLATRSAGEIPFGPYLAVASVGLVLGWNHVADYLRDSLEGMGILLGPVAPLVGL